MLALAQVHILTSAIVASTTSTTVAPKAKGGSPEFIIILVLLALLYFFYLRPRRAKMLAAQQARNGTGPIEIQAGDTVVTTAGIIGRVLSIDGDRATVEIAPDTVVEFHRTALGRRLDPETPEPPDEGDRWASLTSDDHASDEWHDDPLHPGSAPDGPISPEHGEGISGEEPPGGDQ